MNRRSFIGLMIGGVAGVAAERTWPFRVFSFPKDIVVAPPFVVDSTLNVQWITKEALEILKRDLKFMQVEEQSVLTLPISSKLNIKRPQRIGEGNCLSQFGVDIPVPYSTLESGNREEFRKTVIEPAMKSLAAQAKQHKVHKVARLSAPELPRWAEAAAASQNETLGIRAVHAYDIAYDRYVLRFDTLVEHA